MDDVSGFLKRFTQLLQHKDYVVDVCIEVLESVAHVQVTKQDIRLKNKVLTTNISGAMKSQVFMRKNSVITEVNTRIGKTVLTDIR